MSRALDGAAMDERTHAAAPAAGAAPRLAPDGAAALAAPAVPAPDDAVPPGYEPAFIEAGSFLGMCGLIYQRHRDDGRAPVLALRVQPKHLNLRGIVHGGLLVTLADSALGHAINHARQQPLGVVTVSLATDFVETARLGDWIEADVDIQRVGGRMAFANCYLHVGERRILRASGVFAVVQAEKKV